MFKTRGPLSQYCHPNSIPYNRRRDVILSTASKSTGCAVSYNFVSGSRWPEVLYPQDQSSEHKAPRIGGAVGKGGLRTATKAAILVGCLIFGSAHAQAPYERTEVVTVDSVNAGDLLRRADRWVAETFNTAAAVVQLRDTVEGVILGKGRFVMVGLTGRDTYMDFRFEVGTKPGRARLRIYDVMNGSTVMLNDTACFGPWVEPSAPASMKSKQSIALWHESMSAARVGLRHQCATLFAKMDTLIASFMVSMKVAPKSDW